MCVAQALHLTTTELAEQPNSPGGDLIRGLNFADCVAFCEAYCDRLGRIGGMIVHSGYLYTFQMQ